MGALAEGSCRTGRQSLDSLGLNYGSATSCDLGHAIRTLTSRMGSWETERVQDGSCAVFLGDRQGLGPCPWPPLLHLTDANGRHSEGGGEDPAHLSQHPAPGPALPKRRAQALEGDEREGHGDGSPARLCAPPLKLAGLERARLDPWGRAPPLGAGTTGCVPRGCWLPPGCEVYAHGRSGGVSDPWHSLSQGVGQEPTCSFIWGLGALDPTQGACLERRTMRS